MKLLLLQSVSMQRHWVEQVTPAQRRLLEDFRREVEGKRTYG